jgi:hypothetical protein
MPTIEKLVGVGPRWPEAAGDEPATDLLAGELRRVGRDVEVERIRIRPAFHLTLALLAALAVVGSVLSVGTPPLGVVILLIASALIYADLTGRFSPVRYLTSPRKTANVSSPGPRPDATSRVVLVAHHDAAPASLLFARLRRRARRRSVLGRIAGPIDVLFWSAIAALVVALVHLLTGSDATAIKIAQFALTVILLGFTALLVDTALARIVPGANDNASGVAAVLDVAERLERKPTAYIDVWIVFTAAEEGFMLGMKTWLAQHAEDLHTDRTYFLNVNAVGNGELHHATAEGFGLVYRHDRRLAGLCERLGSRPTVLRLGTDGVTAAMRGYPSITICALDRSGRIPNLHRPSDTVENLDPPALERAADFVEDLVREIDRALAPAQAGEPSASRS